MKYLINHPHEDTIYSRRDIFRTNEIPPQSFFKAGNYDIKKTQEYYNFPYTYYDADNENDISNRSSSTSTDQPFIGIIID